jgi:exoribonuclease R
MNHFKPHLSVSNIESFSTKESANSSSSNNQYKKGILSYASIIDTKSTLETRLTPTNTFISSYQVNGISVINNRGIHNDEVVYNSDNNEVVAIPWRSKQVIVGILHLNSNKKFGFTKRKVPYYKFTPVTKKYPSFIVPSKDLRRTAMICVISFNKWETTNKNPIGQIEKLVGAVGDFDVETEMLLYKNSIYPKKNKIKYNAETAEPGLNIYNTVSIDPLGCKDIDDALSFKLLADNKAEVSIHIANVAQWIDRHNITTNLYSTIYLKNGNQINMLDDDITYNKLSLGNNGIPKKAMSLFLVYDIVSTNTNIYTLVESYFKEVMVKNTALSYSKSDDILAKDKAKLDNNSIYKTNSIEWMIVNLAALCGGYGYDDEVPSIPSTKMVEHFMLLYNKIAAEKLYNFNKNTILRTHLLASSPPPPPNSQYEDTDPKFTNYLHILNQNAAEYVANPNNTYHESIGSQYYTHATSPIRRFIDVINQLNLQIMISRDSKKDFIEPTPEYLDKINKFNKNLRKFYNNYKKLNIVYTFNNTTSPTDDILLSENQQFMDAYIVAIKPFKLQLYIPSLDIEHSCQPISPKLMQSNHVVIAQSEEDMPPNKMIINDITLNLHDKIKIKLTVLPYEEQFNKKLYITLVEPHITLL